MRKTILFISLLMCLAAGTAAADFFQDGYDEGKAKGSNVSLDTTDFDNNLDSTIETVQDLADAVDELSTSGGADSVGTSELNDGTDTPSVGECVVVDSSDTSKFEYIACPGSAGGDSITVNGTETVDPDFIDSAQIEWFYSSGQIYGLIKANSVDISSDTNFTAGTNVTLVGDTLNVKDVFLLNTGDTGTGTYDFTGATLQLPASAVDDIGEISSSLRSGDDSTMVTGSGTSGQCAQWDANGNLNDSGSPCQNGDITAVFDTSSGDANQVTVETNEYLDVDPGGEVESTEVVIHVNNDSGSTIYACTAVYISGFDIPSNLPEISIADSDATANAVGLVKEDIAAGANGKVIASGLEDTWDTATAEGWSVGDALYLNDSGMSADSDCGNTLTNVRPANTDDNVQKIGTVLRVHATQGEIEISGAGRYNDLPNLQDAKIWVGNGSNVATAVSLSGDATMSNTGTLTLSSGAVDSIPIIDSSILSGDDLTLLTGTPAGSVRGAAWDGSGNVVKETQFHVRFSIPYPTADLDDQIVYIDNDGGVTIDSIYSITTTTGTVVFFLTDGTNDLDTQTAGTLGTTDSSLSNNTFTTGEAVKLDTTSVSGTNIESFWVDITGTKNY